MEALSMMVNHRFRADQLSMVLAVFFAALCALAGCASNAADRKVDFELTGTVRDAVTRQPIEGAYVIAGYMTWTEGGHDRQDRCVKTRGMYTGKDGRFRFPVEKLDGLSPNPVPSAIKSGYFRGDVRLPARDVWQKQGAEAYVDHDVYLNPQDPVKPNFAFAFGGDDACAHARTREDAAAGAQFMRIKLAEIVRLGAKPEGVEAVRSLLRQMESLPSEKK